MSQTDETPKVHRAKLVPPLVSATDVSPANRPRAHFDDGIEFAIKETARRRAPTRSSEWRHRVGFAGELGAASYFGVRADWSITDDYVGDGGCDFIYNDSRIEVKTTTSERDLELVVPADRVEDADYFVLAKCSRPEELVHLIGWVSRPELEVFGYRFDGKIRVEAEYLNPFEPFELFPDKIRSTQKL
jgi:hypothetical protein